MGKWSNGEWDARRRAGFRRALLTWYRRTARDLPWRRTRDPHRIWLAEVLLQQTRVETGQPYYERLIAAFPNVGALAEASLDDVLELWQGLGYYRRARNLHNAARQIVEERRGRFPRTAAQWRELPGIGDYTAGAIASIAFGERVPAIDGNVKRVLARLFCIKTGIEKPVSSARMKNIAEVLLPRAAPGEFNQAMMELGARVCMPRRPRCATCPVQRWCAARAAGVQAKLPARRAKRPPVPIEGVAALIRKNGRYLLMKRAPDGLLGGLWGLPSGPLNGGESPAAALAGWLERTLTVQVAIGSALGVVTHVFSHRRLRLHVYACRHVRGRPRAEPPMQARWVRRAELEHLPLSALDRKVLVKWLNG